MTAAEPQLRQKNLELFRAFAPEIHARLTAPREDAASFEPLPLSDKQRIRFGVGTPSADKMDHYTFKFLSAALKRASDADIRMVEWTVDERTQYLLMFGVHHHAAMTSEIARTQCLALLIVEPDMAALDWSLDHVDWREIFMLVQDRGGQVEFIFKDTATEISTVVWQTVRGINPAGTDGMTCVTFGHPEFAPQAIEALSKEISLAYTALGFFYDESMMLWNAYRNLSESDARVYVRSYQANRPLPAFVIGSGPSLDSDIAAIKKNRDGVIVISCGSALRPLLRNGIVPDFQIETENIDVSPLVKQAAVEHDISSIVLFASTTIEPGVLPAFREVVYFFRYALSSFPLFSPSVDSTILLPDPTVGNAGVSLALEMGFREIYLFGLDCGSIAAGAHHARDAFQNSPEGAAFPLAHYDIEVPGNFGGVCRTDSGLFASLTNIGEAARLLGKDRRIRNCANGAKIPDVEAMRSAELDVPPLPQATRAQIVDGIVATYPAYRAQDQNFPWMGADFDDTIRKYCAMIAKEIEGLRTSIDQSYKLRLMAIFQPNVGLSAPPPKGIAYAINTLFRGTMFAILLFYERAANRIADPKDLATFKNIAADEMIRVLGLLEAEALRMFGGDRPLPPPPFDTHMAPAGSKLPAVPEPARNDPCPCRSGKKYKHCHGDRRH